MMSTDKNKTKVALIQCSEYDNKQLRLKIEEGIKHIGFDLKQFKGKKVILKPSILSPFPAERAVTTHPEFFRAAARVIKNFGGHPLMVESPAVISLKKAIKKTRFQQVIQEEGIEVADEKETATLKYQDGLMFKKFEISKALFDADIILNLPKFKTHDLTYLTGSVKSLFGTVPGLNKAKWHTKANSPEIFVEFLLDLYGALNHAFEKKKRILHLMDGILGLEGDGPGASGQPRKIGVIIIGADGIAVDYLQTQIACFDENRVLIVKRGKERKLGFASLEDIDVVGEKIESIKVSDYRPPSTKLRMPLRIEQKILFSTTVKNLFTEKPVIREDLCKQCYQCEKICASKAIKRGNKKKVPNIRYDLCIRCYCCLEICPKAAITLKTGRLQWLMNMMNR